jgi:DNA end-binding protein Ku
MARSIWKGHISFGLVQIPVELHTAVRDQDLNFDLLDKRDMGRVGYKRVNKRTGEEVPSSEIVKGYEYEDGQYVIVEDEDFAKANVEATRSVDIVAFVDAAEIDPRYMVKPYYVTPTQRSAKAYGLLREVMRRTGKVGIAKVVLRSRQYVAALVVKDGMLVLELLRYAAEVLDPATFELPAEDLKKLGVSPKELEMAERLVGGLEESWDPKAYTDEYRADLMALIEEKARSGGVTPVATPIAEEDGGGGGNVVDIMELLKRSVAAAEPRKAEPTKKAAPKKTAAKAETDADDEAEAAPARKPRARAKG